MTDSSSQLCRRFARALCGAVAAALLIAAASPAWAWQTAHGRPDNSGAEDVPTIPAVTPLTSINGLGGIAPGVVPVIAPNGTLYIGNARGKLMSFRPDGTPGWSRDIGQQSIMSAPALGTDGSIYVIGAATIRDRRTTPATVTHIAELHKFTASGGWAWHVPLPAAESDLVTSAPPNILRMGGADVVLVPTIQKSAAPFHARLTAFSETGGVLADQIVTSFVPETSGTGIGFGPWFCQAVLRGALCTYTPPGPVPSDPNDLIPANTPVPFPAVAIHVPAGGGTPIVMMSGAFQDLVGLTFTGNAFEEQFRVRDDKRFFTSPPLARPDGRVMIGSGGYDIASDVVLASLNIGTIRAAGPTSFAAPTALGDSRFAIVHRGGGVSVLRETEIEKIVELPGESIASAAASRNHVFVATASALLTFDKATMEQKGSFPWSAGGASQPVIGPQGHVYAIAGDTMFIFPPTLSASTGDPQTPMPTQPSQAYAPPRTANGNRLFACLELDGDDCGKGDYGSIAKAFCAKQGYAQANGINVDSKKVKAETLDGQFCSKKKCKVFDKIVCAM